VNLSILALTISCKKFDFDNNSTQTYQYKIIDGIVTSLILCLTSVNQNNMAEVSSIYPALPITENSSVVQSENITPQTVNSQLINSNSIDSIVSDLNEDNQENISPSNNQENSQQPVPQKPYSTVFKDFLESWKSTDDTKQKQKLRNEINDTFILNTGTEVTNDNIDMIFNKGDFFVARRIWDKTEGKCHDHFVFVKERRDESLDVIHISDISPSGSKPIEDTWGVTMLKENISNEAISLMKFNFLDLQDHADVILERARDYEVPKDEVRSFHYACSCAFGAKLPVYSAEQLSLCREKTLLLFTKKNIDLEEEGIIMLLHSVDDDGKLNVSLSYDDGEVQSYSKEDLFEYKDNQYNIYYFPNSPIDPPTRTDFVSTILNEKVRQLPKQGAKKIVKKGVKAGIKETMSSGLKGAVNAKILSPQLAKSIGSKAAGPVIDVVMGAGEAGVATYQHRTKEKKYDETGGVKGFSRTRANRKITKEWTSAATGTAGGIGSAVVLTAGAATIGQMAIPIPFVGAAIGATVLSPFVFLGSAVGGVASGKIGGLVSSKIYNKNMETKCPFCQTYKKL